MASRLYSEALSEFKKRMSQELKSSQEYQLLESFLATREAPERAAQEAESLKSQTDKKWSDRKVGKITVPAHWINNIMKNINRFIIIGNTVMEGAPESAGLGWLAVRLILSAIQGNYELYSLFGTGLTDITEVMILIPHYDQLYDDGSKQLRKGDSLVGMLFDNIKEAYIAVLRFSFEIKRHVSASPLTKVTHVIADLFGASKLKFQDFLDKIKTHKSRVLEYNIAAYQDKSLKFNEKQEVDMKALKNTLDDMRTFHDNEKKYRDEFIAEIHAMKQTIEASTKPKTPWDFAIVNFEKMKKRLNPEDGTQAPLATALSKRFAGTCQWILKDKDFLKWYQSQSSELLCITGGKGTGKSTLIGSIVEYLCDNMSKDNTIPIYFSCETSTKAKTIFNTLLYHVYTHAKNEENNASLLEECTAVFSHPKSAEFTNARGNDAGAKARGNDSGAKARGGIAHLIGNDDSLAEFAVAIPKLSTLLKRSVVVIIDAVDSLEVDDQKYLTNQIRTVLTTIQERECSGVHIKILVGCQVPLRSAYSELNIEARTHDDMKTRLSAELKSLQGIPAEELEQAANTILKKAGPSFSYITEIGIPFIRQPFQGTFDKRLDMLPEPREMPSTYNEAIQKMEPNYLDLLRVAVTWCLLAPDRVLTVEVVMDVFHGTYQSEDPGNKTRIDEYDDMSFPLASKLEKGQLEDTQGPFLALDFNDANPSLVSLRNYDQVRDFCIEGVSHQRPQNNGSQVCSRCGVIYTSGSKTLFVSEREGHLDIALTSLRHLNNPLFQKRAGLLFEEIIETKKEEAHETLIDDATLEPPTASIAVDTKEHEEDATGEASNCRIDAANGDIGDGKFADEIDGVKEAGKDKIDHGHENESEGADNDANSDGSMDEEDNAVEASVSGNEQDRDPVPEHTSRYEMNFWPYHLLKAEELWNEEERVGNDKWTEISTQLDRLCENTAVFDAWQKVYNYQEPNDFFQSPKKPLHVASYLGLTKWAKRMLDHKQDPNELSGSLNALQSATMRSLSPDMLRLLLERGGDINAESESAKPAFYSCLKQRPSVETIKLMLEHGADPLVRDKLNGWTALHYFAWTGEDPEALKLLLSHPSVAADGEYINSKNRDQDTPLHVLLWRREVPIELLTAFLDHGASVNEDDSYSTRPLQLASIWGELKCLEILLRDTKLIDDDDNYGHTALHFAASYGHAKCVDLLVRKGANVNRVNKQGQTPICEAAWNDEKDCVEQLLQHGADINSTDTHNRTPLFYACQGSTQETARLILDILLEKKVPISEINKVTKGFRTPLRQAASAGFDQVVQKLIAEARMNNDMACLQLDQRDTRHGMTPLHRASWNGHNECVRALLQAGADVKIPVKDQKVRTALVLAYEKWDLSRQNPYEDVIFQLIEKNPLAAKDDAELLSLCAAHGSIRIIRQLQGISADFSLRDKYGWTPLELARQFQRADVEQILKKQAAWKGLLPSRWERSDLKNVISEDGLNITHINGARVCVTTDRPLPAGLDDFYFEITSEPLETHLKLEYPEVAIGFCTLRGNTIRFPGWPPQDQAKSAASWGYHGDDGGFYCSTGDGLPAFINSSLRYRSGDTVGCGVDLKMGKIWFTKNGELLKHSFQDAHGRLFPVVGLRDPIRFSTTFVGPFKWNRDAEQDEHDANASEAVGIPPNTPE